MGNEGKQMLGHLNQRYEPGDPSAVDCENMWGDPTTRRSEPLSRDIKFILRLSADLARTNSLQSHQNVATGIGPLLDKVWSRTMSPTC